MKLSVIFTILPYSTHVLSCHHSRRLWYVYNTELTKIALQSSSPTEIGYMNVIPKCLDSLAKYPVYENLPDTYAAINAYLAESPLEGIRTQHLLCSAVRGRDWVRFVLRHAVLWTRTSTMYDVKWNEVSVELNNNNDLFTGMLRWRHSQVAMHGSNMSTVKQTVEWLQNVPGALRKLYR